MVNNPGDRFMADAILATSLMGAALAASAANLAHARAEANERHRREWDWMSAAEYWRSRALRAERLLAAAEAELDSID
jgi:hypothetical protein